MALRMRPWIVGAAALLLCLGLGAARATDGAAMGSGTAALVASQQQSAGAMVFERNCQICHGRMASGRLGPPLNVLPPEIVALPPEVIAQELTALVRGGIPGAMPMFLPEQVSDADIVELTSYLLSINGTVPGPQLYEAAQPITAEQAAGRTFFAATGHSVGGEFQTFWGRNGGLAIFGYPLTEEYNGIGEDGRVYRMQMFERARMELDPSAPAGQRVRLSRIGAEEVQLRSHFLDLRQEGGGPPPEGGPPAEGTP
jgi:mono/diheme cytochrome c family protein